MPPSYLTVCFPMYALSNFSLPPLAEPEIVNCPTPSLPLPTILLPATAKLFQIISSFLPLYSYHPLTFIQVPLIVYMVPENWEEEEEEEEEKEEEEGLFRANAVNEEDPERDRATQV